MWRSFTALGRWSTAAILEEHEFTADLSGPLRIPVVCPLAVPIEQPQSTLFTAGGLSLCFISKRCGRALEPRNSGEQLEDSWSPPWTAYHQVGKAKPFQHRPMLVCSADLLPRASNVLVELSLLPRKLTVGFRSYFCSPWCRTVFCRLTGHSLSALFGCTVIATHRQFIVERPGFNLG